MRISTFSLEKMNKKMKKKMNKNQKKKKLDNKESREMDTLCRRSEKLELELR